MKAFLASVSEFKKLYALTAIAMLLALRVVLGIFANTTLPLFGNAVKISASFLPIALTGALFGPFPAAIVGALGDILSYVLMPSGGSFFPGFTVSGLLTGLIYGFALYKKPLTLPRVAIAWVINLLVVDTFLAALWLFLLYGGEYGVWLSTRFLSGAVRCIPEILLIFGVGKLTQRLDNMIKRKKT